LGAVVRMTAGSLGAWVGPVKQTWQDAEKVRQRRSRIAQRLNVRITP